MKPALLAVFCCPGGNIDSLRCTNPAPYWEGTTQSCSHHNAAPLNGPIQQRLYSLRDVPAGTMKADGLIFTGAKISLE